MGPITRSIASAVTTPARSRRGVVPGEVEQRRAEALGSPPAVDDQRDMDPEAGDHLGRGQRARRARGVRARRGQRPPGGLDDGPRGLVAGNAERHAGRSLVDQRRKRRGRGARQHQGQRAGPEFFGERASGRGEVPTGRRHRLRGDEGDERLVGRAALGVENTGHGIVTGGIGGEAVDRIGRQTDQPALADHPRGPRDGRLRRRQARGGGRGVGARHGRRSAPLATNGGLTNPALP